MPFRLTTALSFLSGPGQAPYLQNREGLSSDTQNFGEMKQYVKCENYKV